MTRSVRILGDPKPARLLGAPSTHKVEKHKKLIDRWERARAYRAQFEINVLHNLLFYAGRQWVYFSATANQFQDMIIPEGKRKVTSNYYRPLIQERINRTIRSRGEWSVIPATPDPEDKSRATRDEQFLKYLWRTIDMDVEWASMAHWLHITGTGCLRPFWNDGIGPLIEREVVDAEGKAKITQRCPDCEGTGYEGGKATKLALGSTAPYLAPICPTCEGRRGLPETVTVPAGDVDVDAVSWFDWWVEPGCKSPYDSEIFYEQFILSVDEVKRRYPHAAPWITPDKPMQTYNFGIGDVYPAVGALNTLDNLGGQPLYDQVVVCRAWCKPDDDYPQGAVYDFTDKWLLAEYKNPYPECGHFPHVIFTDLTVPGQMYGQSIGDDLRECQTLINSIEARIVENVNLRTNPVLLDPIGSMAHEQGPIVPGRRLKYNRVAGKPEFLEGPELSNWVFQYLESKKAQMRDIAMSTPLVPTTQISGRHQALLDEQADKNNTFQFVTLNAGLRKLGRTTLSIAKKLYPDDRQFAILGRGHGVKFGTMSPETSDPHSNQDVFVTGGNVLPDNKTARFELVLGQLAPFIVDKDTKLPDYKRILELVDIGSPELDDDALDRENALEAIEFMVSSGQPAPINPFANHRVHFHETVTESKKHAFTSPAYNALITYAAQVKQIMDMEQMRQLMMSQAQIAGGTTPGAVPNAQADAPAEPGANAAGDMMGAALGNESAAQKVKKADAKGEKAAQSKEAASRAKL